MVYGQAEGEEEEAWPLGMSSTTPPTGRYSQPEAEGEQEQQYAGG
eukprot:COSAG05_NODE_5398_length_1188_cov_0.801653_1_plen_44_part_10